MIKTYYNIQGCCSCHTSYEALQDKDPGYQMSTQEERQGKGTEYKEESNSFVTLFPMFMEYSHQLQIL